MAKTPQNAERLMTDMVPAATAKARDEAARMQRIIDAEKGGFTLGAADWVFYAGKVQKAEYDLDAAQAAPYFVLDRVLNDGVFFAATRLYGITFKERKDIPVYQAGRARLGGRRRRRQAAGALLRRLLLPAEQERRGVVRHLRRPEPPARNAARRRQRHELLQARGRAAGVPDLRQRDDALPRVRPRAARHLPERRLPDARKHAERLRRVSVAVQRALGAGALGAGSLRPPHSDGRAAAAGDRREDQAQSGTFNQGYLTTEYLAAALLDMAWHTLPPDAPLQDVDTFEPAALRRFRVDLPQVPPRYRTTYFSHIWDGAYAAGYYAYLWSDVLDEDTYSWFQEQRRHDAGERAAIPGHDPLARRLAGRRGPVPGLPRAAIRSSSRCCASAGCSLRSRFQALSATRMPLRRAGVVARLAPDGGDPETRARARPAMTERVGALAPGVPTDTLVARTIFGLVVRETPDGPMAKPAGVPEEAGARLGAPEALLDRRSRGAEIIARFRRRFEFRKIRDGFDWVAVFGFFADKDRVPTIKILVQVRAATRPLAICEAGLALVDRLAQGLI